MFSDQRGYEKYKKVHRIMKNGSGAGAIVALVVLVCTLNWGHPVGAVFAALWMSLSAMVHGYSACCLDQLSLWVDMVNTVKETQRLIKVAADERDSLRSKGNACDRG